MLSTNKPHLLKLADYHDPVLREVAKEVLFPLSVEDKQIIKDMKYSIQKPQLKKAKAPWEGASGMAANQWGIRKRIFLFCPYGDESKAQVIINPSYEAILDVMGSTHVSEEGLESCFSIPLAVGNVRRFTRIKASYQNEQGDILIRELEGWPSRVWQHETDHLNGSLYDDPHSGKCLFKKIFESKKAIDEFYHGL